MKLFLVKFSQKVAEEKEIEIYADDEDHAWDKLINHDYDEKDIHYLDSEPMEDPQKIEIELLEEETEEEVPVDDDF